MRRRLPLLLLAAPLLGACPASREPPAPGAPPLVQGPWLLDATPGSATVAWTADAPATGRVFYRRPGDAELAAEDDREGVDHRVRLAHLLPGVRYDYRIEGEEGAVHSFSTPPPPGTATPLHILVYGDNRTNGGDHALVARAAAAEHPDLALHTGDLVVDATDERAWRQWFAEERDLLASAPFVSTVGNHELTDEGAAWARFFGTRGRAPYRAVDYGPVRVLVLDSYELTAGATPRSAAFSDAQRGWLLATLKATPADRFVWILLHQGPFAHPAHQRPGHGPNEAVKQLLLEAAQVHPIQIVFSGHEHFYERGESEGLRYALLGGGGAPLEDPEPRADGMLFSAKALSYAVVDVCGCQVSMKAKDIQGRVLDSAVLSTCATACPSKASATAAHGKSP